MGKAILQIIKDVSGTQLCPDCVDVFLSGLTQQAMNLTAQFTSNPG
jgi:hypothetical protein